MFIDGMSCFGGSPYYKLENLPATPQEAFNRLNASLAGRDQMTQPGVSIRRENAWLSGDQTIYIRNIGSPLDTLRVRKITHYFSDHVEYQVESLNLESFLDEWAPQQIFSSMQYYIGQHSWSHFDTMLFATAMSARTNLTCPELTFGNGTY